MKTMRHLAFASRLPLRVSGPAARQRTRSSTMKLALNLAGAAFWFIAPLTVLLMLTRPK